VTQSPTTSAFTLSEGYEKQGEELKNLVALAIESGATAADLGEEVAKLCSTPAAPVSPPPAPATTVKAPESKPAAAPPAKAQVKVESPKPTTPAPQQVAKPAPQASNTPSPQTIAEDAYRLLQNPDVLAGVFRRKWAAPMTGAIVENLIRYGAEHNKQALAKMYLRLRDTVLSMYEEIEKDGKLALQEKQEEAVAA
jgi:hypothetical protein